MVDKSRIVCRDRKRLNTGFLPRDIVRECAIRGLSVRADALRNLQNFALEYPSGDALHALIDAIVARLEHCTIRVVDTAIAR